MKAMFLNGSPRKNWSTALLLKEAQKGAESVGAETEYIDLYDLNFTGCRSCMLCKSKAKEPGKCYWKDDLSPVIDRILASDAMFIGSPIYFSETTSQFHALLERLRFCVLSYDDYTLYYKGKLNVGIFFTMNAPKELYEKNYEDFLKNQVRIATQYNGKSIVYPCCDTLQVKDYSKFRMAGFDEQRKLKNRETQWPKDLENAFKMGVELCSQ